jgi:hypothetical protein
MRPIHPHNRPNWPKYARILDLHLAGLSLRQIGEIEDLSRERVRRMIIVAKRRLAGQIFKGLRPRRSYDWRGK